MVDYYGSTDTHDWSPDCRGANCDKFVAAVEYDAQAARNRELEAALRELRTCTEPGCKLCFACLLHIERHVTPSETTAERSEP